MAAAPRSMLVISWLAWLATATLGQSLVQLTSNLTQSDIHPSISADGQTVAWSEFDAATRAADHLVARAPGFVPVRLGGLPRGRLTDLIGRATAGRGTIAARTVAGASGYAAWIDVAGQLDVDYMARCGVNLERLFILRPRDAADAFGIAAQVITCDQFAVVVFDALSDLTPGGRIWY